jgi:hypothetical protein
MTITVREMTDSEFELVIDYFFQSTPEYLETLGVDPTRLPAPNSWREQWSDRFQMEKRHQDYNYASAFGFPKFVNGAR